MLTRPFASSDLDISSTFFELHSWRLLPGFSFVRRSDTSVRRHSILHQRRYS